MARTHEQPAQGAKKSSQLLSAVLFKWQVARRDEPFEELAGAFNVSSLQACVTSQRCPTMEKSLTGNWKSCIM
eukprot:scaffold4414_cov135-Isochrysis_galbana.AAC.3